MAAAADDKQKVLKLALDKIEKDFGKGSVMLLGDKQNETIDVISTGSLGLDVALGVGGLPRGRVIEIYGPESSGKTTIAIHTIAEAQKKGEKLGNENQPIPFLSERQRMSEESRDGFS
jgi:recombination protein RecA